MKKQTKHILIGSSIAASLGMLGFLYGKTAKYLMQLALNREAPKSSGKQKASGSEVLADLLAKANIAGQRLENRTHEVVHIHGYDDTVLMGHWFPCENPKRMIIAMHGWRSTWYQDFGMIADFLFQNDCSVLFPEQRGQGGSGGDYMGFGLLERYDCLDWINWINEHTSGSLPLYLSGISMGATSVLMASGFNLPSNVRGIVADCGFTSPQAIWEHVARNNFHIPYGIYRQTTDNLCKRHIQVSADSYSTIEAMKEATVPILFIHGTDDHFVPVEMTYENYKACRSKKYLFVVPGAEHGQSYVVDQLGYEKQVVAFWEKYDPGVSIFEENASNSTNK